MCFNSPEIYTFKTHLDSCIQSAERHEPTTHTAIKIQSLLDITIYVLATRFIEASVKHCVYNCSLMRGASEQELNQLVSRLKGFNNPEFSNIKDMVEQELGYNILNDKDIHYTDRDISFLNEICRNRHRNVHASHDPREWYNANRKSIADFKKEYEGLLKITLYLESLSFNQQNNAFECGL